MFTGVEMGKIFLLLCGLFCLSFFAEAQTPSTEEIVATKETSNSVSENSSEMNRVDKKYEISLMPVGFGPNPGVSTGVNFGYYINKDSTVLLSYSYISKGRSCWGFYSCSDSGQSFGVHYKKFVSNSFYYSFGFYHRQVTFNEQLTNSAPDDYNYSFTGTSNDVGMSIGNQWQWKTFTLGCDWIGMSYPFATQIDNEVVTGNGVSAQSSLKQQENNYVKSMRSLGLRFYMGTSF